ncbi:CCR4-Not complex component [Aphelenchoides besseyi]|nr:CCR4-Not complex component [Aphelenchoides besseyi]
MSGGTTMEQASAAPHGNEEQAIKYLTQFVQTPVQNEEDIKKREDSIIELGSMLVRNKRTHELRHMIEVTRPFLVALGKAKAAKMVRDLVDMCLQIDQDGDIELIEESIEWATAQNRNFLRQTLQARLVRLLNDLQPTELIRELKKVDDKDLIVEVQLEESKASYFLGSLSKARAALTSARTTANSMYIPPSMQAELDLQSGILHAADERDFKTAFSYFYEAFEGYDLANNPTEATRALKYMLLCKVMLDVPDEISHIIATKHASKYLGDEITAMLAIGTAAKNRSLKEFHEAFGKYKKELQEDPVVRKHFNALNDSMLEKELCRHIEPYSYVQISHIAESIGLAPDKVEKKLAQMILDRKVYDQKLPGGTARESLNSTDFQLQPVTDVDFSLPRNTDPEDELNNQNTTVAAFSFTRFEDFARVENSTLLEYETLNSRNEEATVLQNLHAVALEVLSEKFTESVEACRNHVESLLGGDPSPADVARLITTMLVFNSQSESQLNALGGPIEARPLPWDGKIFADAVKELSPNLDWNKVIDSFDQTQYFNLSWLTQITNHPTIFNVFDYPHKLVNTQCLKVLPDESDRSLMTWRCLDLIDVLFRLGENTTFSRIVYTLLQNPGPIHKCPDILALVIVQLTSNLTAYRVYVFRQVITQLINGHANSVPVLNYVWNVERNTEAFHSVITTCFVDHYAFDDPTRLTRILELAHELKPNGLGELFNLQQYTFAIDLACLAARRDFLKLDKFLDDKLNDVGEPFAQHLCHFIKKRIGPGTTNQLSPEIIQTICSALQCRANSMPWVMNELGPLLHQLRLPNSVNSQFGHNISRPGTGQANWMLQNSANISALRANQGPSTPMDFRPVGRDSGPNVLPNEIAMLNNAFAADDDLSSAVFSEATQERANWYFQRELLSCLLKNLFDEYRFFAEYPERELRTTAKVYGGIIREGIVVNMKFATAIRRIVEALQSPHGSLLNMFGMVAINECRACLHKYTKICHMVSTLECYNWLNDELREYITYGAQGILPPSHVANLSSGQGTGADNMRNTPQPLQSTTPLRFPMRTLTAGEMKELIRSQDKNFIPWLAQYLVIRRITTEQNHQNMYNNFLMAIDDENLNEHILRETYRNIQTLLNSDKRHAASNFSDRQLLKSLGLWLGSITIARDEPILYNDLNLKGLLLDAFYRGQQDLLYVVPFIAKVLLATSKSVIFNPRCTWIYNIMKVLAEIHNEPDLQLNLKFEIEVVCKELQLELREIEVTGELKDSSRLPSLYQPKGNGSRMDNPSPIMPALSYRQQIDMGDQRISNIMQSMQQIASATTPTSGLSQQQVSRQQHMMQQKAALSAAMNVHQKQQHVQMSNFGSGIMNSYNQMETTLTAENTQQSELFMFVNSVESGQTNLNAFPQIKFIVQQAIMAAVSNELLAGIINKATSVTVTATRCLTRKDFAMSPDENQLRRAAQQMMRSMNLGMATITSREQLMTSLQSNLRQAFQAQFCNGQSELPKVLEHAVMLLAEANIEPATNHIARNACEKAVQDVEASMSRDFEIRAEGRNEGRPFKPDPQLISLNSKLPEMLRMSVGTISEEAFRVYEEFNRPTANSTDFGVEELDTMRRTAGLGVEQTPSATNFDLQTRLQGPQSRIPVDAGYQFTDGNSPAYLQSVMDVNRSPDNLQHKAESTFRDWINMCQRANRDQENYMQIITIMREAGLLNDKIISEFFKHCTKICFDVVYRLNESPQQTNNRARCYIPLDAFAKLSCVMVKFSDNQTGKLNLLKKILSILVNALITDHNSRREDFNGMPFLRIFISMFTELTAEDQLLDPLAADILQGTIRIMLVILNDFPDVFCEYHYVLCDVIPPHCLQLRNLVLSASPRDMRLPDAMTPKVTEKPELVSMMYENPVMHNELSALLDSEVMRSVLSIEVRTRLDNYLRHRTPVDFLSELRNMFMINPSPGCQYNISIVNAIVMHVGAFAIDSIKEKTLRICINTVANTACMDIFQNLVVTLCTQGRYLLFNAIANQLRYPNSHTTYFSNTLLYLFLQAHTTEVQEQITRILLERLLIKWPRPWGVLMTFTELIKKEEYQFWKCEFVRCAPEIRRILANIEQISPLYT